MPSRCCRAPPIRSRQEPPPRDYGNGSISPTGFILPQPSRPKPGRRLGYLRGQSRGFVLLEKGTGAAETMLYQSCIGRARMETRPSKEQARCACIWSPNPEELQGKRRDRPKRQTTRTNKALGSNSG
ncbi:uncharacterized protein [Drosophila suzukii]|uniref:Uncharacterized protein isoform X3 n=1 Tax=Drosophila suzukii TaxID=28584 RepID=A0ABM4TSB3_DROSZ